MPDIGFEAAILVTDAMTHAARFRSSLIPLTLLGLAARIATSCSDPAASAPSPAVLHREDAAEPAKDAEAGLTCPSPPSVAETPIRPLRILFFTKEAQYFHTAAHDAGEISVPAALRERGHAVVVSADVGVFTRESLAAYDVIVFFVTSGRVLVEPGHRAAFVDFVHAGKGIAGAHTATATDLDWVDERGVFFMPELFGAAFLGHGGGANGVSDAGLIVTDGGALTAFLPQPWIRRDEWYYYHLNPALRPEVRTVVWLDESWITPLGADYSPVGIYGDAGHPISWTKEFECSRVFYTAMGHTGETWTEDLVIRHFVAGVEWSGAAASERPATP